MSHNLTQFVHSVKVPRIYKNAAKIVQIAILNGGSIKHLLYSTVKANIKGCYALVTKTVQNNDYLDDLLLKTEILKENPRLDVFLAKTLITELLFGKGSLQGESKPVQTIQRYADIIFKEFEAGNASSVNNTKSGTCLFTEIISSRSNSLVTAMEEGGTIFLFLICTFAMFTLPFLTFFGVRDVLQNYFGIVGFASTVGAVVASVVVIYLIIFVYAWFAYNEEVTDEKSSEGDEDSIKKQN